MISNKPTLNESLLKAVSARHEAIVNNIANADTPHFKKKAVVFEEELNRKIAAKYDEGIGLTQTHAKHMPTKSTTNEVPFKMVEVNLTTMNNNGNNVDIDVEMANLAENQLLHNYLVDRVNGHYSKIKNLLNTLK